MKKISKSSLKNNSGFLLGQGKREYFSTFKFTVSEQPHNILIYLDLHFSGAQSNPYTLKRLVGA